MKQILLALLSGAILSSIPMAAAEKIFVVERESSAIAVIEHDALKSKITGMHNMNHGVVKFDGADGYLISRDGYVVKFDPMSEKILAEYKTSKSAIGFVIGKNYVAVANYDDKSVDILTRDLKPIDKIVTGSKNVGIKIYDDKLIFAQMDSDKVTILKDENFGKGLPKFKTFKTFNVGKMPFDAMIQKNTYIVGFFLTKGFGVINLNTMTYTLIKVTAEGNKQVLKVPHFGFWSLSRNKTFVPAVGDNKVMVYDKQFGFIKNIEMKGLPVFTSLSPNEKYIAVTFSGKNFPTIQIVDTQSLKIVQTFTFPGKVLHVRWSSERPVLFVSVNDASEVDLIDTRTWKIVKKIPHVEHPSGIFIYKH